jgi:hypothetical protein
VRCGHDSTIRAGVQVGENGTVGAKPVLRRDVPAHHVTVGTPPESIPVKPGRESVAEDVENANGDRCEERRIEYELPDDLDTFDEFGRDPHPPTDGRSIACPPTIRTFDSPDAAVSSAPMGRRSTPTRLCTPDRSPVIADHRRPSATVGGRWRSSVTVGSCRGTNQSC